MASQRGSHACFLIGEAKGGCGVLLKQQSTVAAYPD
tara:strand:- start:437 stop:544 length:108 start_codon:yes stop_codon:yes gene_type:complete